MLLVGLVMVALVLAPTPASANPALKDVIYDDDGNVDYIDFHVYDISRGVSGSIHLTVTPGGDWDIDAYAHNSHLLPRRARWQCHVYYGFFLDGETLSFTIQTGRRSIPGGQSRTLRADGTASVLEDPIYFEDLVKWGAADCDIIVG